MDRFILLFVFIGLIISIYCNTDDDDLFLRDIVRRDKHTKFILFGSRHGNRNPTKFLNESHGVYGFEGSLELTAVSHFLPHLKGQLSIFSLIIF